MGNQIIFLYFIILNFGHIYIFILITINKKMKYFNNKQVNIILNED